MGALARFFRKVWGILTCRRHEPTPETSPARLLNLAGGIGAHPSYDTRRTPVGPYGHSFGTDAGPTVISQDASNALVSELRTFIAPGGPISPTIVHTPETAPLPIGPPTPILLGNRPPESRTNFPVDNPATTSPNTPSGRESGESSSDNPSDPSSVLERQISVNASASTQGISNTQSSSRTTLVDNAGTTPSTVPESLTSSSAGSSRAIHTSPPGEKPLGRVSVDDLSNPRDVLPKDPVVEVAPSTEDVKDVLSPVQAVPSPTSVDDVEATPSTMREGPRHSLVDNSNPPVADPSTYSSGDLSSGAIINTPPAGVSATAIRSNHPHTSESPADATSSSSSNTQQSSQPTGSQNRDNPTLVILLGNSGSGRSTFINTAIGDTAMVVGNNLEECTTDVTSIRYQSPTSGREYIFVDTPPTNGKSQPKNLPGSIHTMFPRLEHTNVVIIFLFRRESRRASRDDAREHKEICEDIIGHEGWARTTVVVVTGRPASDVQEATLRSQLLDIWGPNGPNVDRFTGTPDDAWRLIDQVVPE